MFQLFIKQTNGFYEPHALAISNYSVKENIIEPWDPVLFLFVCLFFVSVIGLCLNIITKYALILVEIYVIC